MLALLTHFYQNAETYTVLLSWTTVPLGFYASYYFMNKHFGMFTAREDAEPRRGRDHGAH